VVPPPPAGRPSHLARVGPGAEVECILSRTPERALAARAPLPTTDPGDGRKSGTPLNRHALDVLQYREALEIVARGASSELGGAAVRALTPAVEREAVVAALRPVAEMMSMISGDEGWGLPAIPDLREPLRRLRVEGSVWEAPALHSAGILIVSSRTVRRDLRAHRDRLPLLHAIAETLVDIPRIGRGDQQGDQ
jgi:hypothetical protein